MRRRWLWILLILPFLVPLPGHAQEHRTAWRIRMEAGPGKVDWWNDAGLFLQLGLSVAASDTAPVAFDVKLIDGRGGDFGSNSEGFVFGLIGPELRFLPASPVSPFVAAHVGIGFDMDGGMTAATGEAGVRLRTST